MAYTSLNDWVSFTFGRPSYPCGTSPLERLPNELLFRILEFLVKDRPSNSSYPRSWLMQENLPVDINASRSTVSILPSLLASRRLHAVAISLLYRDVKLLQKQEQAPAQDAPHCSFFYSIDENQNLPPLVRSLDITDYHHSQWPKNLAATLSLLPGLRSLRLQLGEVISLEEIDIHRIFFGMPELKSLTIENSNGKTNPASLSRVFQGFQHLDESIHSGIRSLTIRSNSGPLELSGPEGFFVDDDIFINVLSRFPKIQALDLASTPFDAKSLFAINNKTRLQYLRISDCQDSSTLAKFLITHPAVTSSLLALDATEIRFGDRDTLEILSNLPPNLRSLGLSSSSMGFNHLPQLQKLCTHLDELSVGNGLTMADVESMILGRSFEFDADSRPAQNENFHKISLGHEAVLGPMVDAIAVCKLRRRLASVSCRDSRRLRSRLQFLDISSLSAYEQGRITNSVLLGSHSKPLEMVLVPNIKADEYRTLKKLCGGHGWRDKWNSGSVRIERS